MQKSSNSKFLLHFCPTNYIFITVFKIELKWEPLNEEDTPTAVSTQPCFMYCFVSFIALDLNLSGKWTHFEKRHYPFIACSMATIFLLVASL